MRVELRRGLPRVEGGEPWPPAGTVEVEGPARQEGNAAASSAPVAAAVPAPADHGARVEVPLRCGLPRTPGGEPWPPAGSTAWVDAPAPQDLPREDEDSANAATATPAASETDGVELTEVQVRRGLPRTPGGEPWPPAGTTALVPVVPETPSVEPETDPASAAPIAALSPTAEPARKPEPAPKPEPAQAAGAVDKQSRNRSWGALLLALGLLVLGVAGSRWFLGTDAGADFIARYDGEQPLPDGAPVGLPAWLNWAHFFNMFLMAMIVKTGIDVRREQRPEAYWQPKRGGKKISVTLWLHQCLDVAWVALGVIFYVLLFATGQWVRIVPTSWETIPNAVSAGLQYLSLDWPTENGWVFYNALQELAYFTTVFIAAPLAIVSGFRMSGMWPKGWTWLPVSWARAVHFPTMIYFVVFTVVHVFLVLTTGLRRNMNAMFAARGDVDPGVYAADWTGTLIFILAAAVTAAGWWAAKSSVVTPVAQATGKVTRR